MFSPLPSSLTSSLTPSLIPIHLLTTLRCSLRCPGSCPRARHSSMAIRRHSSRQLRACVRWSAGWTALLQSSKSSRNRRPPSSRPMQFLDDCSSHTHTHTHARARAYAHTFGFFLSALRVRQVTVPFHFICINFVFGGLWNL